MSGKKRNNQDTKTGANAKAAPVARAATGTEMDRRTVSIRALRMSMPGESQTFALLAEGDPGNDPGSVQVPGIAMSGKKRNNQDTKTGANAKAAPVARAATGTEMDRRTVSIRALRMSM